MLSENKVRKETYCEYRILDCEIFHSVSKKIVQRNTLL
nr:MAG TPA: hypothetical protein [Caudoviricetes sp.]